MTEGQYLIIDLVSGGFALLILRILDHWFQRTQKNRADLLDQASEKL